MTPMQNVNRDWGYAPLSGMETSFGQLRTSTTQLSDDVRPTYRFRSTSPYLNAAGKAVDGIEFHRPGQLRTEYDPFNPPDEDMPIGQLPTPPVGEPLVMMLMAVLYIGFRAWRIRRQRKAVSNARA